MTNIIKYGKNIVETNNTLTGNINKYRKALEDNLPYDISYCIRYYDFNITTHKDFSGLKYTLKMGFTGQFCSNYSPAEFYDILKYIIGFNDFIVEDVHFYTDRGYLIRYLVIIDLNYYKII